MPSRGNGPFCDGGVQAFRLLNVAGFSFALGQQPVGNWPAVPPPSIPSEHGPLAAMLKFIDAVAAPLALVALLVLVWLYFPRQATEARARQSAVLGRWLGVVLFVLFVLTRSGSFDAISPSGRAPSILPQWLVIGLVFGLALPKLTEIALRIRTLGLMTAPLVASLMVAIYSYYFISGVRGALLYLVLGLGAGALAYRIVSPRIR
jgi:hypothetical protein